MRAQKVDQAVTQPHESRMPVIVAVRIVPGEVMVVMLVSHAVPPA